MGNTKPYTKIMATHPIQGLESQKPVDPFSSSSSIPGSTPVLLEQVPDVKIPPDSVGETLVEAEPDVALPHGLSHLLLQGLFLGNLRGCRRKIHLKNVQETLKLQAVPWLEREGRFGEQGEGLEGQS